MVRRYRLYHSMIGFISVIAFVVSSTLSALVTGTAFGVADAARHMFRPAYSPDATTVLELEAAARLRSTEPVPRSRFQAFIERAKSHINFDGDGFILGDRLIA